MHHRLLHLKKRWKSSRLTAPNGKSPNQRKRFGLFFGLAVHCLLAKSVCALSDEAGATINQTGI